MITSLELSNFKGFRSLKLPLYPITLLTGLNGMGKSSVLQALLLLRQSFQSGDLAAGRLLIGGELVDLGTGSDLLFEDAEEDEIAIGFRSSAGHLDDASWRARFVYDRTADRLQEVRNDKVAEITPSVPPFSGQFTYVQAERLGPRKMLPLSDARVLAFDMGPKGEYVLHILMEHGAVSLSEQDPRLRDRSKFKLVDQVDSWLQEISPGSHLAIEMVRAADLAIGGFKFDREGDVSTRAFRATNVGFGLSYVLPVLVALLGTRPGGLVLLENPEAHLHPQGQTRIGQLAARAAAAGVQVIAETHSDHFMDGVRIAVRDGNIAPSSVAFHYFDRRGSEAYVVSPQIDAEGRISEWPRGFFDQHDENLAHLLAPKENA